MTPEEYERIHQHLMDRAFPKPAPLIFGMIPWMFWTLLAIVLFAVFGPEIAYLLRK